jgi:hypothetical protein
MENKESEPALLKQYTVHTGLGKTLLAASFMLVSCLVYSLTLMMEAIHSSDMLVDFRQIA